MSLRALASVEALIPRIERRQARAVGRAISLAESGGDVARELIAHLYPKTGRASVIGVTGPAGAGKSTLVDRLARRARSAGKIVGILAIDPTSPFTGGALLGDRIRMQELYTDPDVFIRSMATRGAMGGLAAAAHDAVDVLDAAGFDLILLETVGVGQDEVDVVRSVDTVVVLAIPGMGDDIQASKAGLLEIADVYAVNKADRDGAERVFKDLHWMLHLAADAADAADTADTVATDSGRAQWQPPVVKTTASTGDGVEELATAIEDHGRYLRASGRLAGRRRRRFIMRVEHRLRQAVLAVVDRARDGSSSSGGSPGESSGVLEQAVQAGMAEVIDPYQVADRLLDRAMAAPFSVEPRLD